MKASPQLNTKIPKVRARELIGCEVQTAWYGWTDGQMCGPKLDSEKLPLHPVTKPSLQHASSLVPCTGPWSSGVLSALQRSSSSVARLSTLETQGVLKGFLGYVRTVCYLGLLFTL